MASPQLSKVTLPEASHLPSIVDYLARRFPRVPLAVWEERIMKGKVFDEAGIAITADTPYLPGKRIFYAREVEQEPVIPSAESIVFRNDHLLVACKPHFLPVNPTGPYVEECLMNRLRKSTGINDLVPVNRIDRETAGIVMFSARKESRNLYYELFRRGVIEKSYEAVAACRVAPKERIWRVQNRLVEGEPWFRMKVAPGEINARSVIRLLEVREGKGLFRLQPLTGKTHQLRLQMSGLDFPIINDRYYPDLLPKSDDDFDNPLQLLARSVRFIDPVTGERMEFSSTRTLSCWC